MIFPKFNRVSFCSQKGDMSAEKAQSLIGKWVKNNKLCLFMKGNPENPKCGYSKLMV